MRHPEDVDVDSGDDDDNDELNSGNDDDEFDPDDADDGDLNSGGALVRASMLTCPYCGERFEIAIDLTQGKRQDWILDCEICCRPIRVTISGTRRRTAIGHSMDEV